MGGRKLDVDKAKQNAKTAAEAVINALHSFGLRKYSRIPIVFNFQTDSEPSGWGTGNKAGSYWGYLIDWYGSDDESVVKIVKVIAHEVGHHVYRSLSQQDRDRIKPLASTTKISDYGRPDYLFQGLNTPTPQHSSGEEWFCEMLAFWASNPHSSQGGVHNQVKDFSGSWLDPDKAKSFLQSQRQVKQVFANQTPVQGDKSQAEHPFYRVPRRYKSRKHDKSMQRPPDDGPVPPDRLRKPGTILP